MLLLLLLLLWKREGLINARRQAGGSRKGRKGACVPPHPSFAAGHACVCVCVCVRPRREGGRGEAASTYTLTR